MGAYAGSRFLLKPRRPLIRTAAPPMPVPSTLAGKVLWLRAKDNAGANASAITTWVDQSGTGSDASAAGGGTAPAVATGSTPSGGKSVAFVNSGYFTTTVTKLLSNLLTISATTASSVYDGSTANQVSNATDGDPNTSWSAGAGACWLRLQVASAAVQWYQVIARNDGYYANAPTAWTFQGSNDGTTWTTLDTQTSQTFTSGQARPYTLTNTTAYIYYRLNISAYGGGNASLAELQLATTTTGPIMPGEIWIVVKSAAGADGCLWGFNDTSGYPEQYLYSGQIYETFGLASARPVFTPTLAVTSWRLYRVVSDGTTWQAWLDGVSQATSPNTTVAWLDGVSNLACIGASRRGSYSNGINGNIAEILFRSQISTSGEVASLITYFNTEHGLTVAGGGVQGALSRPRVMRSFAAQRASRW